MKNKVLLFYGKFENNQPHDWLPYGILYLTAPLVKAGFEPIFISEYITPDYEKEIKKHANDSIVFGISAVSGVQITSGLKAAKIFKECSPNTPIVWGGAHPTAVPEQTIKHDLVDIVCVGPSEDSFVSLVSAIQNKETFNHIQGLLFKKNNEIINTGKPYLSDLTNLPPFKFDILEIEKYINPKTRVLNYTASCGCPGNCTFCSWGGKHPNRRLLIKRVLDDIEWLTKTYNLNTIWFSDADFFYNKEFALEISKGITNRNLNIYWEANGRVVDMFKYSKAEMKQLNQSGLSNIFLGIESTNEKMKKIMNKHYRNSQVDYILDISKDLDIDFYLSFIFGSPLESVKNIETTYNVLKHWQSINANVKFQTSIFTPYPGTSMTTLAVENGLKIPETLEGWGTFDLVNLQRNSWSNRPWFSDSFNEEYGKKFDTTFPNYPARVFKETKPNRRTL